MAREAPEYLVDHGQSALVRAHGCPPVLLKSLDGVRLARDAEHHSKRRVSYPTEATTTSSSVHKPNVAPLWRLRSSRTWRRRLQAAHGGCRYTKLPSNPGRLHTSSQRGPDQADLGGRQFLHAQALGCLRAGRRLIRPDGRDQSWVNHRACSKAWVSRRCPSFKAAVISRAKPASSSSASAATDAVKLEKVLVTG
jgi:hypothetical protein